MTPSKGAMRAALLIGRSDGFHWVDSAIEKCARIIDRETHAGDMAELLRRYLDGDGSKQFLLEVKRLLKELES